MFAIERQEKIAGIVREKGSVSINELMRMFAVSSETVRRDILCLEKKNKLRRIHGGAVSAESNRPYAELSERMEEAGSEKSELAEYAMRYINEGDFIAVDSGSTAVKFSECLSRNFERLTVLTNSLDVLEILRRKSGMDIILTGGNLYAAENALCGEAAINTLKNHHVSAAFVFPSAVSLAFGISDNTPDLIPIQHAFMESADKVYILADSGKFEKNAFIKMSETERGYTYITDSKLSVVIADAYREKGIGIINK